MYSRGKNIGFEKAGRGRVATSQQSSAPDSTSALGSTSCHSRDDVSNKSSSGSRPLEDVSNKTSGSYKIMFGLIYLQNYVII
jgi:hypothetical protein